MTDEERSIEGYTLYLKIRDKQARGATMKHPRSAEFFADQIPRFNRRLEKTYVSIGQLKWLRGINKFGMTKATRPK